MARIRYQVYFLYHRIGDEKERKKQRLSPDQNELQKESSLRRAHERIWQTSAPPD